MLKINHLFWKKILIIILMIVCVTIETQNSDIIEAQETKEDKCDQLPDNYSKVFKECFGVELIDTLAPTQIEGFGITNLEYEWARLDILSTMLNENSKLVGYIVIYGGKLNKYGELKERPKPLIHYLINKRGIDLKRIKVIEGGFREKFEFELWISQSEKMFPPLTPTIEREKVVFRGKMKPLPLDMDYDIAN